MLEKGYSGYKFPITKDQAAAAKNLLAILEGAPGNASEAFHHFIKPLFFSSEEEINMLDYSKWNNVLECAYALLFLQKDGNFRQPHEITQTFAHFLYGIRGAVLYEGSLHVSNHKHDLYKFVFYFYFVAFMPFAYSLKLI
jgi:hypothetical protein